MPNIASVLKSEIVRIARKEIRSEVESLKKSVSSQRVEIAALKRRCLALEQELRRVGKTLPKPTPVAADESPKALRFSAKGLAKQRQRLGLSAEDCGFLLGASGQSVYNWESGNARPRANHLPAISALRSLGKKQAATVLATRNAT
jgi:DNA-binding transcriptional regulator YiaG